MVSDGGLTLLVAVATVATCSLFLTFQLPAFFNALFNASFKLGTKSIAFQFCLSLLFSPFALFPSVSFF